MAKDWAKPFYNSKIWRETRASFISHRQAVDGGLCEDCKKQLGFIVHHKTPLTRRNITDPLIASNHNNLKYVCKDCHELYDDDGNKKVHLIPRCEFDSDGNPIKRK